MTDRTMDTEMERWHEEQALLRRKAQRFDDLCRRLALVMRPNETPEEAVKALVTGA